MEIVTPERLAAFVAAQQARYDAYVLATTPEYLLEKYPDMHKCTISATFGNKFVRVVREGPGERSVVCFINSENGDILKAGGWKAPAKNGVRGSIHTADLGASCMDHWGTRYLR